MKFGEFCKDIAYGLMFLQGCIVSLFSTVYFVLDAGFDVNLIKLF